MKTERRESKKIDVDVDKLIAWELQPRKHFDDEKHKQLVASVAEHGVVQSLVVRYTDEEGVYQIVCGERRWRAAKAAGVVDVPASLRYLDDKAAMELAVLENVQRDDLDVFEEAAGYKAMIELGFSVKELSQRFKHPQSFFYGRLDLLKLGDAEREAVLDKQISKRVAEALSRIEDEGKRADALKEIVKPSHHSGPLPLESALRVVKNHYLEPQKAAKEWARKRKKLMKEFPDAEVVEFDNELNIRGWNSPYANVESSPSSWDVVESLQDEEDSIPTWGQLGKKYGAKVVIVPPDTRGAEPRHLVEKQPIIDADVTQAKGAKAVFPKPASEEESKAEKQEHERRKAEHEARGARRKEQLKQLVLDLKGKKYFKAVYAKAAHYLLEAYEMDLTEVYNLLHDAKLNNYNDDDCAEVAKWVDGVMKEMGNEGLVWLLVAESVVWGVFDAGRTAEWVKVTKLKAGDYPDLVAEEGEGDE